MNLYFIFVKNTYEDLPVHTNDGLVYYYWLLEDKKIYITKQNRTKNKTYRINFSVTFIYIMYRNIKIILHKKI